MPFFNMHMACHYCVKVAVINPNAASHFLINVERLNAQKCQSEKTAGEW